MQLDSTKWSVACLSTYSVRFCSARNAFTWLRKQVSAAGHSVRSKGIRGSSLSTRSLQCHGILSLVITNSWSKMSCRCSHRHTLGQLLQQKGIHLLNLATFISIRTNSWHEWRRVNKQFPLQRMCCLTSNT